MKDTASFFLFSFASLFTVVNPFGAMPVFLSMTGSLSKDMSKKLAQRAAMTACVAMAGFALAGDFLFGFFSISVDGLRVVGGILFFITGYDMLQGKEARTKAVEGEDREKVKEAAITPLGIPLLCGPGAITASMVLIKDANTALESGIVFFSIFLVSFLTFFFLVGAGRIMSLLGSSGNKVFMRLMGLIIMMIAIEFFFSGLKPYVFKMING